MSTKNSFSTKQLTSDLRSLIVSVRRAADTAVAKVTKEVADRNPVLLAFDEAEVIPFAAGGRGTVTVVTNATDPAELELELSALSVETTDALAREVSENMKGVIK